MEALKQLAPGLKRVVTIYNPNTAPYFPLYMRAIEQATPSFAMEPIGVEVHDDAEIERAISAVAREAGGGLIVMPDTLTWPIAEQRSDSRPDIACRQFTLCRFLRGRAG
jgi:putative ABC transport system substrate-binding protein